MDAFYFHLSRAENGVGYLVYDYTQTVGHGNTDIMSQPGIICVCACSRSEPSSLLGLDGSQTFYFTATLPSAVWKLGTKRQHIRYGRSHAHRPDICPILARPDFVRCYPGLTIHGAFARSVHYKGSCRCTHHVSLHRVLIHRKAIVLGACRETLANEGGYARGVKHGCRLL